MSISEVKLWSETVVNGSNGNGFFVTVNAVLGGVAQNLGTFTFDYASTLTTKNETIYSPVGLSLQTGDMIEILYGDRGSWPYDHGNVNAFITEGASAPSNSVPEPSSLWLAALAMGAMVSASKRKALVRPPPRPLRKRS